MAYRIVLMILPALVLTEINIFLTGTFGGNNATDLMIFESGDDVGIITDREINTFKLSDNILKKCINMCFGRRPDNVYLHSPTPWGDLYRLYNWKQVTRTLKPLSTKITGFHTVPKYTASYTGQFYENTGPKPKMFDVTISKIVKNEVNSFWGKEGELSIRQNIDYGIKLELIDVGSEFSMFYNSLWGQNDYHLQFFRVGSKSSMEVVVQPDQYIVSKLQSTVGVIELEIKYESSLSGYIAMNYDSAYKGDHFRAFDIDVCMNLTGLRNQIISTEILLVSFYIDTKAVVLDRVTGEKLMEVAC